MDLNSLPKNKDTYDNVNLGPLSSKEYEAVKEYLNSLGVGYSASYVDKKSMLVVTTQKQLARGGIILSFSEEKLT